MKANTDRFMNGFLYYKIADVPENVRRLGTKTPVDTDLLSMTGSTHRFFM